MPEGGAAAVISMTDWLQRRGAENKTTDRLATARSVLANITDSAASAAADSGAAWHGGDEAAKNAFDAAVKLLARRPLSTAEVWRELEKQELPAAAAESAVAECVERGYIDERALAESVRDKAAGCSPAQLRRKLQQRQISGEIITEIITELDAAEQEELLQQAATDRAYKLQGLEYQVAFRRLCGFLARRGWSGYTATEAAKQALQNAGIGD